MNNPLGARIRQLANNKKLTIAKLEKIAGLPNSAIRDLIIGKSKNPTFDTLTKIRNALECSFYDLLKNEHNYQSNSSQSKINTYANTEWNHSLFTKCTETIEKYLNKYELRFALSKVLVLIMDLYLYSLTENNNQLDEKSAEWLIKKLKVSISVRAHLIENSPGMRIKQLATDKNLAISKLEKLAELKNGMVRDIIIGKSKNPTLKTLTKICDVLEYPVYELLDDEEIFQKYNLLTAAEPYIDSEWDYALFVQCLEIFGYYLNKHRFSITLSKVISLIRDLYLWSLFENNKPVPDTNFDEKLLEKLNLMVEKRIIFDKNFIQGSKKEELEKYNKFPYIPIITQGLKLECLGDLAKDCKKYETYLKKLGKTKEWYAAGHFKKIQDFPFAEYNHMNLVNIELFNGQAIKIKHNLFDFKLSSSSNINAIDIFDHLDPKEGMNRWINEEFIEKDRVEAKEYRDGRTKDKREELKALIPAELGLDLEEIINFIDSPLNPNGSLSEAIFAYLERIITDKFREKIEQNKQRSILIEKMKGKSLAEVAPYTAYVFAIDAFFHRNFLLKEEGRKIREPDSDWIDFNYLYYLPFIDIFATKDKRLRNIIKNDFKFTSINVIP